VLNTGDLIDVRVFLDHVSTVLKLWYYLRRDHTWTVGLPQIGLAPQPLVQVRFDATISGVKRQDIAPRSHRIVLLREHSVSLSIRTFFFDDCRQYDTGAQDPHHEKLAVLPRPLEDLHWRWHLRSE
jgi:hypothetical protein